MALWAFSQKSDAAAVAATSTTVAGTGLTNVAGNLLVAVVGWTGATTVTGVADTHNTWVPLTGVIDNGTSKSQVFYVLSCVAAANTPTATFSATSTIRSLSWAEYTAPGNNFAATSVDSFNSAVGNSTAVLSAVSSAVAASNELILGFGNVSAGAAGVTWTAGTGFTLRTTAAARSVAIEDNLGTTATPGGVTSSFTINAGQVWAGIVAVFAPGTQPSVYNQIAGSPYSVNRTVPQVTAYQQDFQLVYGNVVTGGGFVGAPQIKV